MFIILIRFTVGNFLSFNKPQEFSMIGGKVRLKEEHLDKGNKINLLKFAAVFGANASGKSNLVASMEFAKAAILTEVPVSAINNYCRINKENKSLPSSFEFEIKLGGKYYAYGLEVIVSESSIVEEWLYEIGPDMAEHEIFSRDTKKKEIKFGKDFDIPVLQTYADSMESNDTVLFLTEMNRNKEDIYLKFASLSPFQEIYRWFEQRLIINYPDDPVSPVPCYIKDENNLDEANRIISSLGLGISRFQIVDANMDEIRKIVPSDVLKRILEDINKKIITAKKKGEKLKGGVMLRGNHNFFFLNVDQNNPEHKVQALQFEHAKNDIWFELNEESDGTRRMLDLVELIFAANSGSNKVYVIDELDRSLHPQLTYKLIDTYLHLVDKSEMQLIVTTHEAHILDLRLLRRDEVWFVDKNTDGESSLYSLEQYNERFDKKIDKAYLDGRYGGVPLFDETYAMKAEIE